MMRSSSRVGRERREQEQVTCIEELIHQYITHLMIRSSSSATRISSARCSSAPSFRCKDVARLGEDTLRGCLPTAVSHPASSTSRAGHE